jgi:hypothetical protein
MKLVRGQPVILVCFGRKGIAKIVLDAERMKNTPIYVC